MKAAFLSRLNVTIIKLTHLSQPYEVGTGTLYFNCLQFMYRTEVHSLAAFRFLTALLKDAIPTAATGVE